MPEFSFHPEAAKEYASAYSWYAERSERIAIEFEREIERGLRLITKYPDSWPKYDDDHRRFLIRRFPFSIIYRKIHDGLMVVAIAHGSRRPDYWRDRSQNN